MRLAAVTGDLRRGLSVSAEDMGIAAMVVAPFVLTLVVLVGWMTWAPSGVLIGLFVVVQLAATVWNAGWRARGAVG